MNTQPAGYIVTDNELIHGYGATADEAWADAMNTLKQSQIAVLGDDDDSEQHDSWCRDSDLTIRSATAALIQDVEDRGGAIGWHMSGGIACTRDEWEG